MKDFFKGVVVVFLALVSCSKENTSESDKKFITVNASFEQVSRTSIGYEDTKPVVFWSERDEMCIYDGANRNKFVLSAGAGSTLATFAGSVSPLSGNAKAYNRYIAIYPYSAGRDAANINYYDESVQNYSYKVQTSIPTEQLCLPGTFAEGASFAVGASSDPESFFVHNALAYMSFDVKGSGIVSVKVENTEDTPLALSGLVQINFVDSGIKSHSGKSGVYPYVALKPATGETLTEGTYYLAVYPQKNGHSKLKITATRNDGATAEINYDGKPLTNKVNSLLILPNVDSSKLKWVEVGLDFAHNADDNIVYIEI